MPEITSPRNTKETANSSQHVKKRVSGTTIHTDFLGPYLVWEHGNPWYQTTMELVVYDLFYVRTLSLTSTGTRSSDKKSIELILEAHSTVFLRNSFETQPKPSSDTKVLLLRSEGP